MWSSLWSILVCKIPQFWEKATDLENHHTFLESRHPDVTGNRYYIFPPRAKKKYQLMDYKRLNKIPVLILIRISKMDDIPEKSRKKNLT